MPPRHRRGQGFSQPAHPGLAPERGHAALEIMSSDREMGETALVFAACALDTLVAQADRIMVLDRHDARAVDRDGFHAKVAEPRGGWRRT